MKDFKYRGKVIEPLQSNEKWIYTSDYMPEVYINHLDKLAYINSVAVEYTTVTPYMGLKDKHDTEIYEGDEFHIGDPNITYTVVWHDTGFKGKQNSASSYIGLSHWNNRIEVIGNIYENPDLLGDD